MDERRGGLFYLYLTLAAIGTIIPYFIFLPWYAGNGLDLHALFTEPFATAPARIFSMDALLSAAVFLVFASVEGRRLGMKRLWLPPLIIVTIGLCCALPLFLAMRERKLQGAR